MMMSLRFHSAATFWGATFAAQQPRPLAEPLALDVFDPLALLERELAESLELALEEGFVGGFGHGDRPLWSHRVGEGRKQAF